MTSSPDRTAMAQLQDARPLQLLMKALIYVQMKNILILNNN
jgi:hypothetical protein